MPVHNDIGCASPIASLAHLQRGNKLFHFFAASLILLLLGGTFANSLRAQETLVSKGATWRWRKGTNEVSNPITAWRTNGFNDTSWPTGNAPFHYGTNSSGGDDALFTGTILTGMSGSYRGIFLRRTFVITNVATVSQLQLDANYDDGFVAWVNGTEVARANVNGQPTYRTNATVSIEPSANNTFVAIPTPQSYLLEGTNVLAVQAFNQNISGSDFRFDTSLQILRLVPLVITNVSPADGATLGALTQITVAFSVPVKGVNAADLRINGQPAAAVSGTAGTNRYTFTFTQPLPGTVSVAWDEVHDITDLFGNPFDATAPNAIWTYTLTDTIAPIVSESTPVAGAQVNQLTQTEITFSEPVAGVSASDLLVNGIPATSVTGAGAGPYIFQFAQPPGGTVQFSWAIGHGITDTADTPNAFAGGDWSVTLNPGHSQGDVIINEFVTGNSTGLLDEDGEPQDWIEIYNRGSNTVNLLGWSLTENAQVPGKWVFPATNLTAGQFLVVFASEKNRRIPGARLHTNFKLDGFGEYLALFNAESPRVPVSEFTPGYPEQRNDYSYGRDNTDVWRYFQTPTPGAPNGSSSIAGIASPPHFSVERGWFDAPFNLVLTTPLPGATIRYTTDGTEPTANTGFVYAGPVTITNTTTLRAAVFRSDYLPSRARTQSYLFLDQVVTQPNTPAGFPSNWGSRSGFGFSNNLVPADYEMDLDPLRVDPLNPASPIDPAKFQRLKTGLRELPVVSVVMNIDDMFGPGGIYNSANVMTKGFPARKCSIEMFLPDGSSAFEATCGIGIHGNASRQPEKNPKHGFKLSFRNEFGDSSLKYRLFPDSPVNEFDDLILRADFGVSWRHWSDVFGEANGSFQRTYASRTRDSWMKEASRDLGVLASHNRFCHLFINGVYWGTYDFSEQPKAVFAANLLGGTANDYDVYEQGDAVGGYVEGTPPGGSASTYNTYQKMSALPSATSDAAYDAFKQYLDTTEYIDYTFLHFFVGHRDWGTVKNWYAIRQRAGGTFANEGTFKYLPWDGECILLNADNSDNRIPNSGGGNNNNSQSTAGGFHAKLMVNAQYRLDFADRVHKHMIAPDGVLTAAANIARWQKWQTLLDDPIVAESARWGDYRRDVHQYLNGTFQLYTREDQWMTENNRMVGDYFPNRTANVLGWLRKAGLYPAIDAPEYRQGSTSGTIIGSARVAAGYGLALNNPNGTGTIYFTTNGVDPRVYYQGTIAGPAQPYSAPLTLNATTVVKSRVLSDGVWSALNEATFTIGELGIPLRITEIMYNPVGGDAFEFIELQNVGALPLNLGGFSFQGITFNFPEGTVLQPGAVLLLANGLNPPAFASRYPTAVVFGYFSGSLSNGGERIAILDRNNQTVVAVHYRDDGGWTTLPDGSGYSLEIIDPRGDPNAASNWRASATLNGTPGLPPTAPAVSSIVINEVMADNASTVTNGGLLPDWIELHNRGVATIDLANWSLSDDSNERKFVFPATAIPADGYLVVWCDSATGAPGLHTGFSLSKSGETISLFDATTNRVDALTFGLQLTDYSVGRIGEEWRLNQPTPNAANTEAPQAAPGNLAINEWLANPGAGGTDWIELYNRSGTTPVALRGIYVSTSNAVCQIQSLSFLAPHGYAQLFADEQSGANQLELKLPASGGSIALSDSTGIELESITYGPQATAVSEGRLPDGTAAITSFANSVSPGASNYLLAYTGPVLNEVLARNSRGAISPWGSSADFVEVFNSTDSSFNLAGMALGNSSDFGHAWTIPPDVNIPANGYLVMWCDGSRPASTSNGNSLNSGFSLPAEGGDVILFNALGQPVDTVSYGTQVEDKSIGRSGGLWQLLSTPTPGANNSGPAALGAVAALRLNEWMASPVSGDDWFELYNPNGLPVDLSGLYLTDNPSSLGLTISPIAPLSFIGANHWVKFFADGKPGAGRDHVNFSLDASGETLRLYDTNLTLIDAVNFGLQTTGASQGRLPDGSTNIVSFPVSATPGAANYLPLTSVIINEILTHTDPPLEDAVELFNPTANPADISGWYLSDSQSDLKRYLIPNGTVIPAGGFKVIYQNQFGPADGETDSPPLFTFNSAHGDSVQLSEADALGNLTGNRASVDFGAAMNGVSFGRYQTSVGVDFVALSQRTFGVDNPESLADFRSGTGASNAYPLVGPVVINEIMYHPASDTNDSSDSEYLELHNLTAAPVPLFDPAATTNVWRIANAVTFDFPPGTTIPAHEFLIVVPFDPINDPNSLAQFQTRYGTNALIVGPYAGKLDNGGETIELWRPDHPQTAPHPDAGFVPQILVERVSYSPLAPWPTGASGSGASLQRIVAQNYGNDPVNWRASLPTLGSANTIPPTGQATLPGNNQIWLAFTVQPGVTYQLEYKNSLTDSTWLPLGGPVSPTNSPLIIDETLDGQTSRFYRLMVLP